MALTRTDPLPFDEYLATCSGASGSALDAAALDFEGRRFLGSTSEGLTVDPVRVYAGTTHGDAFERARAIAAELVRLGAGEREWLVLGAPTGRGWVNHVLVRAIEVLALGSVATACSQFGTARSVKSSAQLDDAVESFRALVATVRAEPALDGCRLVLLGESFGGWTIARLLEELVDAPPYAIVLTATPGVAKLDGRHGETLRALRAAGTRVVRCEHANDPVVACPGTGLAWRPSRAWRVADPRPWIPLVSALRALRLIDEVTRFEDPSQVGITTHDYRADYAAVAAELLEVRDEERVRVVGDELLRLEREESTWFRSYGPEPRLDWPGLGA